jgi:hypothetical protein
MSRISLTIDRLVLRGFEQADSGTIVGGLKSELVRLLSDPVTRAHWAHSQRTPVLRLPSVGLETGTSGRKEFGVGMAREIGKRLK